MILDHLWKDSSVIQCYVDVDRKFKGQHGIVLTLGPWQKVVKALDVVDRKIEAKKLDMATRLGAAQ